MAKSSTPRRPPAPPLTPLERARQELDDPLFAYARAHLPKVPPHLVLEVGESVAVGHLSDVRVVEVHDEGRLLLVQSTHVDNRSGEITSPLLLRPWFDVQRLSDITPRVIASPDRDLVYSQRTVDALLHMATQSGIDDSPVYQRELVWTREDKEAFIDSVFRRLDLGKFVLVDQPYSPGAAHHVILDGKQRLNALISFATDAFPYQGRFYSQMSRLERQLFEGAPLSYALLPEHTSEREQMRVFLRMNAGGKPQTAEHLAHIRASLAELEATAEPALGASPRAQPKP